MAAPGERAHGGAPARNERGWAIPVADRFELLKAMTEGSNKSPGEDAVSASLVNFAQFALDSIKDEEHDIGHTIQALDALRDVHSKFMAALAAPRIRAKAKANADVMQQ